MLSDILFGVEKGSMYSSKNCKFDPSWLEVFPYSLFSRVILAVCTCGVLGGEVRESTCKSCIAPTRWESRVFVFAAKFLNFRPLVSLKFWLRTVLTSLKWFVCFLFVYLGGFPLMFWEVMNSSLFFSRFVSRFPTNNLNRRLVRAFGNSLLFVNLYAWTICPFPVGGSAE